LSAWQAPEQARLTAELSEAKKSLAEVKAEHQAYRYFRLDHPEVARRLDHLGEQITEAVSDFGIERQDIHGTRPESGREELVAYADRRSQEVVLDGNPELALHL
jgi:hypothetical protein